MATWQDLVSFVRANYKIAEEKADSLALDFGMDDGRFQRAMVFLTSQGDGTQWVQVESGIGTIDQLPLRPLLDEVGGKICGGLATIGTLVTFRHAVPLANLDAEEFQRPLAMVTVTADELERKFAGGDTF